MKSVSCHLFPRFAIATVLVAGVVPVAAQSTSALESKLAQLLQAQGVSVQVPVARPHPAALVTAGPAAAANLAPGAVAGLIVRMETTGPAATAGALGQASGVAMRYHRAGGAGAHVLRFNQQLNLDEARVAASRLRRTRGVASVDIDLRVQPNAVPNDSLFAAQHSLATPVQYPGSIDAVRAWDITTGSAQTVIAIVDTGIASHTEFGDRVLPGFDFVTDALRGNDGDGRDRGAEDPGTWVTAADAQATPGCREGTSTWHGTHMAGVAAGGGHNRKGIAGVSWNSRILPVRAMGKCGGAMSDVIDAMLWAAGVPVPGTPVNPHPARIINLSLGTAAPEGCPAAFQNAIAQVRARGALVVVAAGNEAKDAAQHTPANCAGVITVASVNLLGQLSSYSNFNAAGVVALAAPGGDNTMGNSAMIVSTANAGTTAPSTESFALRQGTSVAAAHVSGVAALALAVNPDLSVPELGALLRLTTAAFPTGSSCHTATRCGTGILNAYQMVKAVQALRAYASVTEWRNPDTDRYFRAAGIESTAVEDPRQGRWADTGDAFVAWRSGESGAVPVCRFYSHRVQSHFYTADAGECEQLKRGGEWIFQLVSFYAMPATRGICPQGSLPVQRLSREVAADGARRYRYTTSREVQAGALAQGWRAEGASFCAVS